MGELDLSQLDPGIRGAVAWLRMHGFDTTDSGDGVSKPGDERVLDIPHVFMVVAPEHLVAEADRLLSLLLENGVDVDQIGCEVASIEASYDPVSGTGVITLLRFTC